MVEEHPGPFPYVLGTVSVDRRYKVNFELTGHGVDKDPKGLLSIDQNTGVITVHHKIDYEQVQLLMLQFKARNVSNMAVDTQLGVEIHISDINDNRPRFEHDEYPITIKESQRQGAFVMTVLARDLDKRGSPNSTIDYRIISTTPITQNAEFYMIENGTILFKGCLDYEKAQTYTIIVEAKDRGVPPLSSTCKVIINVEDMNNHFPIFTGHTGTGRVKERETGQTFLRVQVDDKDSRGTSAWKAKYTIHGDTGKNFQIETDSETNEGILSVVLALDFEEGSVRNLSISVENETPYFSCVVKEQPPRGPWKVDYFDSSSGQGGVVRSPMEKISVSVEDVNDPPEFVCPLGDVTVEENTEIGHLLETFIAVDKDKTFNDDFVYLKGSDPAGWVNVGPQDGKITTAKVIDRESDYVKNNTYTITLYAVSTGVPPMTGTATLNIHLTDQNDNVPKLESHMLTMCLSASVVNITAYDLDGDPYSGPFHFELLGDIKGRWRLDPSFGRTVNLIKEEAVYAGSHKLLLKISDAQGKFLQQNLTMTVCDCSTIPNCHARRVTSVIPGGGTVGIVIASLFLFLGVLLLVIFVSCGRHRTMFLVDPGSGATLLKSNIETPGTDCKVPDAQVIQNGRCHEAMSTQSNVKNSTFQQEANSQLRFQDFSTYKKCQVSQQYGAADAFQRGSMRSQNMKGHFQRTLFRGENSSFREQNIPAKYEVLLSILNQKTNSIHDQEDDIIKYEPHVYDDEGTECRGDMQLDAISISEVKFDPDELLHLGPRFSNLAALCSPPSNVGL
nr:cadherin-like protein 26 isoform X2 [Paramormyrops kingsleyae]